jgi:predicted nucleic acid-binding protein
MPGLVYDAGALLAAERRDVAVALLHQRAVRTGVRPIVPAAVLAQAWRGGPRPGLSLLLKGCLILPVDEHLARAAGTACGRARTSDVVDALVVVTAARLDATILTSDPDDLHHLADAINTKLTIRTI